EQGDSAGGGGGVDIQPIVETTGIVTEAVAHLQPKHQRKRKSMIASSLQRLLAGAVLNVDVRGEIVPTLPFVTSSVFAIPEREDEDHTDSVTGHNLRTIRAPQRFVISSDSFHHSGVNVAEAEVDSLIRKKLLSLLCLLPILPSLVELTLTLVIFSDLTRSDFLVNGVRTVIDPDTDLQKVYVPQWSVTNGSLLDDGRVCREMVDEFDPLKFFASVRGIEHDWLFTEFNVRNARQMSLSAEVRKRAEYNIKEKRRLRSAVDKKNKLLKVREKEIENLKAQLLLKKAETAEAIRLRAEASNELEVKVVDLAASVKVREQEVADLDVVVTSVKSQNDILVEQVHGLETSSTGLQEKVTAYESCIYQLDKFQDEKMKEVNEKFDNIYVDFAEMALRLEEKFYPHLLTTIAGRRWLLTYDMKLVIVKCLHSLEYLSTLGAAISKAIKKSLQDRLAAGFTHGQEGRVLTNVVAFNPFVKSDYVSALQELQDVNFSLLAELKSNKDASVETLMNILHLEETLAERLDFNESQPHIRDNIANHRFALRDVFVSLAKPLSAVALEGMEGTSGTAPDTTMALSTTFASTGLVPPISTNDYEIANADDQTVAGEDTILFPNVHDAELNV
ncbi:hypothetical protein Tco_1485673, partial [Tanacetum coccineum]